MTRSLIRKIIIAVLTVVTVLAIFSAVAMIYIFPQLDGLFARVDRPQFSTYLRYSDYELSYPRTVFELESGKNIIKCYSYGEDKTGGVVILCPGLSAGGDSMLPEMMRFVNAGYSVLTFDPTGTWDSEGDSIIGLTQEYLDLDCLLTWVEAQEKFEDRSIYLYGFSSGGYAAAAMLSSDHYITAAAAVSAFENPEDIIAEWTQGSLGILAGQVAKPYIFLYDFFKFGTKCNISAVDSINDSGLPIFIAHGNNDGTVSYGSSSIISHQSEITNPLAMFKTCDSPVQNDHGTVFLSKGSVEARMRFQQEINSLSSQYGGMIPGEEMQALYNSSDLERMNRLDDDFMNQVLDFFDMYQREEDLIKELLKNAPPAETAAE